MFNKIKQQIKKLISEYKKVKWPTPRETVNSALFVIIVSAIITLIIIGLDSFFFELRSRFIL